MRTIDKILLTSTYNTVLYDIIRLSTLSIMEFVTSLNRMFKKKP